MMKLGAKFGLEGTSFGRAAGVPCGTVQLREKLRHGTDDGVPCNTVDEDGPMLDMDSLGMTG